MHAKGASADPVEVLLKRDPVEIVGLLRYRAEPFDPTVRAAPDVDAPLDARPVGGLGVHLVRQLMTRFEHRYADGCNEVTLARPRH
jgi:anti-sigma regulatory factor (Ser/Thr protein kinase)